jgi:hypothetical protein
MVFRQQWKLEKLYYIGQEPVNIFNNWKLWIILDVSFYLERYLYVL